MLAFSYLLGDEKPQHARAIEHFTRAATLGWPWGESHAAYAMALKGDRAQAVVRLRRLEMESRESRAYELAMLHAVLGDSTAAIRCLEDAYQERSGSLMLMDVDFRLSDLPADPRFADLRRRVLGR